MITVDTSALEKQLKEYVIEATKRLENTVAGFAYEFTIKASSNTPIGDEVSLGDETSKYYSLYEQRMRDYGIPIEVGFHKGSWQYSESVSGLQFTASITSPEDAADDAKYSAQSQYKLGDTFYIGSLAPAIEKLDNGEVPGHAAGSISKPTLEQVQQAFAIDVAKYYKEAI